VYRREGLREDDVWRELRTRPPLSSLPENTERIVHYAVTELVNNAIDHSSADQVEVLLSPTRAPVAFDVIDDGVGIFEHLRSRLGLPDGLAALQELSKGKTTTQPERHTGEGIFFVSKIADFFEIDSAGLSWKVDNLRSDMSVGSAPPRRGTRVRFEVNPDKVRSLKEVFDEYAHDYEFSKTRVVVKLFSVGVRFVVGYGKWLWTRGQGGVPASRERKRSASARVAGSPVRAASWA
jgi:anti-sigma regulatory factor (Ser/Thr protein kinase)